MNTFDDFIQKIKRLEICNDYAERVAKAGSKKSFMDIALSSGATSWVCEMIRRGELTPETILYTFKNFNNGAYIRERDGYTSKMYCLPDTDSITIDTTLTLIIGFKGTIAANRLCELYLVNCDVDIVGDGHPIAHSYNSVVRGDNVKVTEH